MSAHTSRVGHLALALLASTLTLAFATSAHAAAQAPWWQINTETSPTNLPPGTEGDVFVLVSNLGDAPIEGANDPVTISTQLPAGLSASAISAPGKNKSPVECSPATLRCTFKGTLYPYEQIGIDLTVGVSQQAAGLSLPVEVGVQGGGAGLATRTLAVPVSSQPAGFGVEDFELSPFNEDGSPASQAGAHPFQLTTTLIMNQTGLKDAQESRFPVALPKDLSFRLPPGLVGNPNAASQCALTDFFALVLETNLCAPASVVGVATVTVHEPLVAKFVTVTVPVFNLVPAQGEPARFGFEVIGKVPVVIDTSVRTGKDYGVIATVHNATQTAGLLSSQVTLWGNPGDPRHNNARGWECVAGGAFAGQAKKPCPSTSAEPERPFLILPTSCASDPAQEPVMSMAETDSWAEPGRYLGAEYSWMNSEGKLLGFEGCSELPFNPEIEVTTEEHSAATPTGLEVKVKVPQKSTLEVGGLSEADVRNTTVALPQGLELNPAAANGLEACSESQIGFTGFDSQTQTQEFTDEKPSCPEASKLGTVKIKTPLLSHELQGSLYLASPAPNGASEGGQNPFNSLVAVYLVAEDPISGVLVKLAGEGQINEETLQLSTSFKNAPQVPFEELTINLFGGARASLATPATCGSYSAEASFTPWSSSETLNLASAPESFLISSSAPGQEGSCPSSPSGEPFAPSISAGSSSSQAGAFASFNLELTRPDGDQALKGLTLHLPQGIAALLSNVALCSEDRADANSCPPSSEIGNATAIAGLGPEPFIQEGGKVFITGPYQGAPFGLQILTPAVAGPFDLGYVSVRSRLRIDPSTAAVSIETPTLPTELRGIPLELKRVLVSVDRPEFQFNPTNCAPMQIEAQISGDQDASHEAKEHFQVQNCQSLPFKPSLTASTHGHASKANGTDFLVSVTSGGVNGHGVAQQGIQKVDLQLPKALPARLTTLQKACTEAAFDENPASCPEGSNIGQATIHTPVLRSPLSGPAYLVSHGNAAFPDVEFVLQGEGITLVLDGKTEIKGGITYSKFESAPDAPFTVFETLLPAGPHSALTADLPEADKFNLCGQSVSMPTEMTSQAGALLKQDTKIKIEGCGAVKAAKERKLTNAQKRAKALASCRKRYEHSRHKLTACERHARRRYPLAGKARKGKHTTAKTRSKHAAKTNGKR